MPQGIETARLVLRPVCGDALTDLIALQGDPAVFGHMLNGVRDPKETAMDLATYIAAWKRLGVGLWHLRCKESLDFAGLCGIAERPDGRGMALRYAVPARMQGRGFSLEAAGAVLAYGHGQAGLRRIVAVAKRSNAGSVAVLERLGMVAAEAFRRGTDTMLVYESRRVDQEAERRAA